MELLGNFTILESMLLFLYGGAVDLSGTAKWSTAMRLLGIGKGEWKEAEARSSEAKAATYFVCGAVLLLETIILAATSA